MSNEKLTEERLAKLEQEIDNLAKRIATMEISRTHYGPFTIPQPHTNWNTNVCALCGLELKGVMGYVCSQPNCPTGLGPVMC